MSLSKRKCRKCDKFLYYDNKSEYCGSCSKEISDQEKIRVWKETGYTNCKTGTTVRNCIRNYIYVKQNFKCSICGMDNHWNNNILNFILDHIDGDCTNDKEENLRLICPNCDSQLPTFKSKNRNSGRKFRNGA